MVGDISEKGCGYLEVHQALIVLQEQKGGVLSSWEWDLFEDPAYCVKSVI